MQNETSEQKHISKTDINFDIAAMIKEIHTVICNHVIN